MKNKKFNDYSILNILKFIIKIDDFIILKYK